MRLSVSRSAAAAAAASATRAAATAAARRRGLVGHAFRSPNATAVAFRNSSSSTATGSSIRTCRRIFGCCDDERPPTRSTATLLSSSWRDVSLRRGTDISGYTCPQCTTSACNSSRSHSTNFAAVRRSFGTVISSAAATRLLALWGDCNGSRGRGQSRRNCQHPKASSSGSTLRRWVATGAREGRGCIAESGDIESSSCCRTLNRSSDSFFSRRTRSSSSSCEECSVAHDSNACSYGGDRRSSGTCETCIGSCNNSTDSSCSSSSASSCSSTKYGCRGLGVAMGSIWWQMIGDGRSRTSRIFRSAAAENTSGSSNTKSGSDNTAARQSCCSSMSSSSGASSRWFTSKDKLVCLPVRKLSVMGCVAPCARVADLTFSFHYNIAAASSCNVCFCWKPWGKGRLTASRQLASALLSADPARAAAAAAHATTCPATMPVALFCSAAGAAVASGALAPREGASASAPAAGPSVAAARRGEASAAAAADPRAAAGASPAHAALAEEQRAAAAAEDPTAALEKRGRSPVFRSAAHRDMLTNVTRMHLQNVLLRRFGLFRTQEARVIGKRQFVVGVLRPWAAFLVDNDLRFDGEDLTAAPAAVAAAAEVPPLAVLQQPAVQELLARDLDIRWFVMQLLLHFLQKQERQQLTTGEQQRQVEEVVMKKGQQQQEGRSENLLVWTSSRSAASGGKEPSVSDLTAAAARAAAAGEKPLQVPQPRFPSVLEMDHPQWPFEPTEIEKYRDLYGVMLKWVYKPRGTVRSVQLLREAMQQEERERRQSSSSRESQQETELAPVDGNALTTTSDTRHIGRSARPSSTASNENKDNQETTEKMGLLRIRTGCTDHYVYAPSELETGFYKEC